MNRHFEDARYYLKRARETAKRGIAEELRPFEERLRSLTGREKESEPETETSRFEKLHVDLDRIEGRVGGGARETVTDVRERLGRSGGTEGSTERA